MQSYNNIYSNYIKSYLYVKMKDSSMTCLVYFHSRWLRIAFIFYWNKKSNVWYGLLVYYTDLLPVEIVAAKTVTIFIIPF